MLTRRDSNPGGHALMRVETTIVANVAEPRATLRDFFGGFGDVSGSLAEDAATSPSTSGFDSASDSDSDWDSDSDVNHPFRAAENCGIHAIAINPSRTRLATGGENPCDAAVFSVSAGDDDASGAAGGLLSPSALLVGHRDWVFGVDWITDNVLASGSRDTTVRIWSVPDSAESSEAHGGVAKTRRGENAVPEIRVPVASIRAHADRVRDVKYVRGARRLASLSVDGTVVFTDPETMAVSETRRLRSRRELMCLATDGVDAVAVGSQAHVALLDHRQRAGRSACEKRLPHDDADGVRSLSFSGGGRLLTVGGGGGRLFFFDVAAGKYLPRVRGEEDEDGSLGARADERRDDAAKDASGVSRTPRACATRAACTATTPSRRRACARRATARGAGTRRRSRFARARGSSTASTTRSWSTSPPRRTGLPRATRATRTPGTPAARGCWSPAGRWRTV